MPVEDDNTSPELNPDKLDLYLEDFRKAIKSSPEIKELADREHLPHYSNLTASYFASMTDNNFVEFFFTFMKSGGDVQSGGERFAGRFAENITKNLEKFRQHIQSVFDNNFNVKNWWSKSNEFAGWGTGTRSIFLCRCFPSRFPILNSKSMEVFRALKVIGANTKQKNSKNPAYYESFRQDLLLLLNRYPELNFFKLDVFAEYLSRVFSLAPEKRTSTEEVKALFEKYFPDRINLDKITSLLCESIEAANSASANKWNISFHKKEGVIRLNVGQIEALAIYPDKIDLILDKNQLPKSLEQIGTPKAWGKSVKDSHLFYLDHNKVHLVDQNISASHVSLIRSASKTQLRESSQRIHSPEVIQYLSEVSGKQLPQPSYHGTSIRETRIWVLGAGSNGNMAQAFLNKSYIAIGMREFKLGDLKNYSNIDAIKEHIKKVYDKLNPPTHNRLATINFLSEIKIGDTIILKSGHQITHAIGRVTSDYYFDESTTDYQHCRKVDWLKHGPWTHPELQYHGKTLTEYTAKTEELKILTQITGFNFTDFSQDQIMDSKTLFTKYAKNTIFYGPPGTGKTYKIINEVMPRFVDKQQALTKEEHLRSLTEEAPLWLVLAAALLETGRQNVAQLMKHELVIARLLHSKAAALKPGVWANLQSHTVTECNFVNYTNRQEPLIFFKNQDSTWEIREEALKNSAPEVYSFLEQSKQIPVASEVKRYEFVTFHQSFTYEDFIEGIKPVLDGESEELRYQIEPGIFKKMAKRAKADPNHNYALVIDEINRGNVANIFGDLITLIEEDKRDTLPVKLPYSKEEFIVPSNLYIFGTMNTADRSVEALDTALRRRFSFVEMMPEPKQLSSKTVGSISLEKLLSTTNTRLERLLDRDHTLGHSYFIDVNSLADLRAAFADKIIPLLKEYFYNDYAKIGLILGANFVKADTSAVSFAAFSTDDYPEDGKNLYVITPASELTESDFISVYQSAK